MVEKKMQKYYWIGGVVGVTTVIFVLALVFVIIPSFKGIGKVNQELKDSQTELKAAESKLSKLKELKVKEDELKEQSRIVYRAIPTKKEVGDIFIQFDGLAKGAGGVSKGNKSTSASTSGTTSPSGASGAEAAVAGITGVSTLTYGEDITFPDYNSFKALLDSSEKALRYVHLNSFKISSKEAFTVNLTYTAYFRSSDSQSASADTTGGTAK